ncbi:hypothetical protein [Virgibacillus dokdonensis]|uniref:hypothetical protein n=1 Tax=Virgibacillus dokdonensis TaxID=302167 RepID=UPI00098B74C1|nr:hypothetical protein [Virgibacillus dokdonensis]
MSKRIKGITIQLDGETKGLDKALKDVNKRSSELNSELREVERGLRFNPKSTTLLAQKQEILTQQVENTSDKLGQLRKAQQQVEKQFKSGGIGEDAYRAFQREVIKTESQLDGFKKKLASVDDGKELDNLQKDMKGVKDEAGKTEKAIDGVESALGGLAAGVGAGTAIQQALDTSSLDTKIDVTFDVPEKSKEAVRGAINEVTTYGIDAEEALEGVRRQWALNANATDEVNSKVAKGASVIASNYSGIDFTELIQETNEIGAALGIGNEEALALTNSLLKANFPPEQLDIIAEYGTQLSMAGYNAEEIQTIFASGVDTKSWNIDNLLDGLGEGRKLLSEFGDEVPKSVEKLIEGTDISSEQLQQWGKDVAKGGETGKQAMSDVAKALVGVDDETKRSQLGVAIFGTMYEDQGKAITDVLINAKKDTFDLKEGTEGFTDAVEEADEDPLKRIREAFVSIKETLKPLLDDIADVVGTFADWAKENSALVSTLAVIGSVITVVLGALMALAPIIFSVTKILGVLKVVGSAVATAIGAISAPIWGTIAAIAGLIAGIVLLWKNWDSVSKWIGETWDWLKAKSVEVVTSLGAFLNEQWQIMKNVIVVVWTAIKNFFAETWNNIKTVATVVWTALKAFLTGVWNGIKSVAMTVFNAVKAFFSSVWNGIKSVTSTVWNAIKSFVTGLWNGIKSTASGIFNGIKDVISGIWNRLKSITSNMWNRIKGIVTGIWDGLKGTVSRVFNSIKDTITGVWDSVKSSTDDIWDGITGSVKGAVNGVIGAINGMINALNGLDIKLPKIPDWVPGLGGKGGQSIGFPNIPNIPKLNVGTNYVAKDGLAYLHEGEAVVPKKYNPAANGGESIDYDKMAMAMVKAMRHLSFEVDGRQLGYIAEPYVTEKQRRNKKVRDSFR